jgi:Sap, sulfolipid-1-addressing protein
MWSSVLGLALLAALHPMRLAIILLMISRPRPVQNLLAYWVGSLIVGVPALLVPLMVLHFTPMFRSFAQDLATPATGTSSTVRHIQIGMGVLALSIAALMTVRFSARPRAHLPTPGGNTSTLVLDSNTPTAISRLPGRAQDAPTEGGSAIRRLLGRANDAWKSLWVAWENGSLWVALVLGLIMVPGDGILFVLAILVGSGAAIGTQVSAAIAFVVGWLAVVEIILVTYLATPAKTQAALRLLHDFAQAHRRKTLVATLAVVGVLGVARGMGIV